MKSINKELLAARFSNASDLYEDATPIQNLMAQNLFKEILRRSESKKITNILELGCGSGRLTTKLVTAFPQSEITAIDIASQMIELAQKKCPTVKYITGDIEEEVFHLSKKFDLIVSSATIQWFENKHKTMQQVNNLLQRDGIVAIATFAKKTFCELSESFTQAYLKNKLDPRSHTVKMQSIESWKKIMPSAEITEEIITKNFANVREFLRSIQKSGAVNSAIINPAIPKAVLAEMIKYYSENFADENGGVKSSYHLCYLFT